MAKQVMAQLELRRVARSEALANGNSEAEKARYMAVIESAIDYAIVVMDRDGNITDWNQRAFCILGWKANEIIGRDVSRFFTPEEISGMPRDAFDRTVMDTLGRIERVELQIEVRLRDASQTGAGV